MARSQIEGFFDLLGFPNDPASKGTFDIKTFFGVTLPNIIYNNDADVDLVKLTRTANVRTQKSESVLNNQWKKGPGKVSSALDAKQAACESVGNGDQFDHLTSMASSVDTQSRLRCGWVYNNANPSSGRGAFGNSDGPFKTTAAGTWMWNLKAAKEKYHTDICKTVQGCPDIDSNIYKQRCGWCTKTGKAVPIVSGGVAYPYSTRTACPPSKLVTQGSRCPPPPPLRDPTGPRAPGEVCTPLQNGALPRDCLIQKLKAAGCSDRGSMEQALKSGSDNDYTSVLKTQDAYKLYQQRATTPLDETGLKTGKLTISDALNSFQRVQDQGSSGANTGLAYAARDLCLQKGALNEFDFCTELQDSTASPFTANCIIKAFGHAGGQIGSTVNLELLLLPLTRNTQVMANWNALGTWGAVKAKIEELKALTKSTDRGKQERAMLEFYGIKLENKRNPLPYGPEIAWKDEKVMLSCQRPLAVPTGYTRHGCVEDDGPETLEQWAEGNKWTMGTPPPPPYKKYPNLDWAGNDIQCLPNKSIDECMAMCDGRGDCVGFCNIKGGYNGCCIKNNLGNRTEHPSGDIDFYIKQPLQCKAPYANPPSEVSGWKYKGCWRDCHQGRGLPNRLGNVGSIEQCIAQAKAAGYNTAGNQYFGECWAGNNTDWNKMGNAGCCEPLGGGCTQQIYSSQ